MKDESDIFYSLYLNYKSWLCFLLGIYLLYTKNIIIGILNFIIFFLFSYIGHYISHMKNIDFFNCVHTYHHKYNNWFGFYTEIIYEFVLATAFTFLKIFIQFICNIHTFDFIIDYINIPLNILIFMFYTSVHYINYSALHINNVHELHHKNVFKNMGPDFCDVLFGTKYEIENTIENTDHYIPNILISIFIIYTLLQIYKYTDFKDYFKYTFFYIYIVACVILFISSTIIFIKFFNKKLHKKYKKLQKKYKRLHKKYKKLQKKYRNLHKD